ncbi:MAG: 4Fe-4S dicluster domain-containing protein [Bacteroidota bacterium]|nr:4Fe-4S dicluster domain-containing protein [Bacteroidota bacterium]
MVDFGFSLSPSSRIDLDEFDRKTFDRLLALEPDAKKCMECGSCSAVCTASRYTETSVRRALHALRNGCAAQAVEELKGCQFCGKCTMVCPRGINTRHLILSILKIYGAL